MVSGLKRSLLDSEPPLLGTKRLKDNNPAPEAIKPAGGGRVDGVADSFAAAQGISGPLSTVAVSSSPRAPPGAIPHATDDTLPTSPSRPTEGHEQPSEDLNGWPDTSRLPPEQIVPGLSALAVETCTDSGRTVARSASPAPPHGSVDDPTDDAASEFEALAVEVKNMAAVVGALKQETIRRLEEAQLAKSKAESRLRSSMDRLQREKDAHRKIEEVLKGTQDVMTDILDCIMQWDTLQGSLGDHTVRIDFDEATWTSDPVERARAIIAQMKASLPI